MSALSLTTRIALLLCVLCMVAAQLTGVHFHRHAIAAHAGAQHGISLHLRDTGVHGHESLQGKDHHAPGDRASHPDDVEIDPLAAGFAKFLKICMGAALPVLAVLWLVAMQPVAVASRWRPPVHQRPSLFVLRPPSHAPPLKLSLSR
jgi:hypothetical protein